MKKISAVILAAFMMLGFWGCRQKNETTEYNDISDTVESQAIVVSEPSKVEESVPENSENSQTETAEISDPAERQQISVPEEQEVAAPPDIRSEGEKYADRLTLEQQIGQMFFARCPESGGAELAAELNVGGYILFGRDFENQTPDSLKQKVDSFQAAAKTPMLIGVDEEGGSVVRVSAYKAFRNSRFLSPRRILSAGGIGALVADAEEKNLLLSSLGINVNLAPVCDLSDNPSDYIYSRTVADDADTASECISALVKNANGHNVGSVLKHFPGYGSNVDTHTGIAVDKRPAEAFFSKDFLPFSAGIAAGAGSVLVSHNIVTAFDENLPASLSPKVHSVLRERLGFSGVIMTDDLVMDAITDFTKETPASVLAVEAGNDMLISSDLKKQYDEVLNAVLSGRISPERIRQSAARVADWKISLGLITPEYNVETAEQ